ncbi:MAG: hypothetical protein GQ529_05015, partial [Methyloprofundus sp.]|nr:hypothetical protein [Methyloprofundus sp.]
MSNTNTLLTRFQQLSEDEQQILLALAILFAPVSQTRLQQILRALNCVEPKVYKQIAKPLREKLVQQGLIEATQHGWRCVTGGISEVLMRIAAQEYPDIFARLAKFSLASREYVPSHLQLIDKVRRLRFFLYLGDDKQFEACFKGIENEFPRDVMSALELLFFSPFDKAWFDSLSGNIKAFVLSCYTKYGAFKLQDISYPLQLLQDSINVGDVNSEAILLSFAEYKIILGDLQDVENLIKEEVSVRGLTLKGSLCFIENRNDAALEFYFAAIQLFKKETRKRNVFLPGIHGYFFNLALLKTREPENLSYLKKQLALVAKSKEASEFTIIQERLLEAINVYQGLKRSLEYHFHLAAGLSAPYELLFHGLILYW